MEVGVKGLIHCPVAWATMCKPYHLPYTLQKDGFSGYSPPRSPHHSENTVWINSVLNGFISFMHCIRLLGEQITKES